LHGALKPPIGSETGLKELNGASETTIGLESGLIVLLVQSASANTERVLKV
jgi:copper chaperone CopZ